MQAVGRVQDKERGRVAILEDSVEHDPRATLVPRDSTFYVLQPVSLCDLISSRNERRAIAGAKGDSR